MDKETRKYAAGIALRVIVYMMIGAALLVALGGCVSYAKVEKTYADGEKCRAIARGTFFSFNTPAVIEECRPDQDR
jgi:hypothetical protein